MTYNGIIRVCQRLSQVTVNKIQPKYSTKPLGICNYSTLGVPVARVRLQCNQWSGACTKQSLVCAGCCVLEGRSYSTSHKGRTSRKRNVQEDNDDGDDGDGDDGDDGGTQKDNLASKSDARLSTALQHHREVVAETFKQIYNMSDYETFPILTAIDLASIDPLELTSTLQLLKDHDIPTEQLQRNTWIVSQPVGNLKQKFRKLKERHLFETTSDGLGMCYFSLEQISNYHKTFIIEASRFPNHPNRLYYIAELLKVPVSRLVEKFIKCHKVLFYKIEHIEKKIAILQHYNITSEDILNDIWVLSYNLDKAQTRLEYALSIGCVPLKPWMCRSSNKIFYNYCERHQYVQKLMGMHKNVTSYLSEQLDCPEEEIKWRFLTNHNLMKVHIIKYKRIIDLLLNEGLTREDIRYCMQVFQFSDKRLTSRIRELKAIGCFPVPISYLCYSVKEFEMRIKKLKSGIA